jgi:hybrid cluster-associated redox disulfide protein
MERAMLQTNRFSPQISIAELLEKWPQAIPIFLGYRLDCVGCSMAAFETLSDVITIYQLPAELFIADLERSIQTIPAEKIFDGADNGEE